MPAPDARPLPRHPRVMWSRIIYRWPFAVWLVAVGACAWLYLNGGRTITVSGVIEVQREEVAPLEASRLLALHVVPGQAVEPGDLLAEFDTSVLDAEMSEIRAQFELDRIQAELQRNQSELQYRRILVDAESELRRILLQQAADRSRLTALQGQLKDLDKVADPLLEAGRGMALFRAEIDALTLNERIYPAAISNLQAEAAVARRELEAARTVKDPELPKELLASLEQRKAGYQIRARYAGTVSRLLHRPGDVVPEAIPVVSIVVAGSYRVIAYLPEWVAHEIEPGRTAWITRPMRSGDAIRASVQTLGPEVLALPTRISPIQGQTLRGRHAVLTLESQSNFLPGESVQIHLSKPWWMDKYEALRSRYSQQPAPASPKS